MVAMLSCSPVFEDLRREHRQLFGREVAFVNDMQVVFANKDQHAVVLILYILGCVLLIDIYD